MKHFYLYRFNVYKYLENNWRYFLPINCNIPWLTHSISKAGLFNSCRYERAKLMCSDIFLEDDCIEEQEGFK